jgi:hypothetical protein
LGEDIDRLFSQAPHEVEPSAEWVLTCSADKPTSGRWRPVELNGAKMSEENVTLDFLAHQIRGMRDDVLSLKEDMSVLTAIVLRLERDAARREARDEDMLAQMRAMVRQHQRFSERLRALEEERR